MPIYLDAVWALNFFFDFLLLVLTDRLAKLNTKRKRLVLGAFVASAIVPITIIYPDSFLISFIGKILFSMLIILTAFGFTRIYRALKLLLLFYFVSFSIGGSMMAFHFLLQHPLENLNNGLLIHKSGFGDPISWLFVMIGFPVALLFTKRRMDKHTQDKIRFDTLYSISIKIKGEEYATDGYLDSGNQLVDMFTKKPVVICDEAFLSKWFDRRDWEQLENAYKSWEMENIPISWIDDLQVVPYQGVEGKDGFIFAIKPDCITIEYEGEVIQSTHFLIGIQFGELTADGRYHCLLQPELISGHRAYSA